MKKCLILSIFLFFSSFSLLNADMGLEIYRDGYIGVEQTIYMNELQLVGEVELISSEVEDIYVTDDNGDPVFYEVEGNKLLLYNIGEEIVHLNYYVSSITNKEGIIWSLSLTAPEDLILMMPADSSVLYIDPLPEEIDLDKNELSFLAGSEIKVEYIIGIGEEGPGYRRPFPLIIMICLIAGLAYAVYRYKKMPMRPWKNDKRLDAMERRALDFILENGDVMESEIRERLKIPKTSSWRMMRRLEDQGYISIKKKNNVNFIELNKRA